MEVIRWVLMKGFFKFIVFVAIVCAAYYYGRPYVEKYLEDREGAAKAPEEAPMAAGGKGRAAPTKGIATEAPKTDPAPAGPSSSEIDDAVMALYPDPVIPPLTEMVNDWNFIPERAFPRKLVLQEAVSIDLVRDGKVIGQRGLAPGSAIIAKAYSEMRVKISPEGSALMETVVPIDSTNLKESIQKGYDAFVEDTHKRVAAQREAEKKRMANMKAGADERERLLAGWTDGSDKVFDPMKVSLGSGGLKDHRVEDAVRWRWLGPEMIGGVSYDAGLVELQVETIFGIFPSEWKALISNGKVEKWVDPVAAR